MKNPLVSVLITVYNDEGNIARAVESILNQSYQHLELVVVNDGSTDGTAAVLAAYQKKDSRIRIINQPNGGTASAANHGLKFCTGKYIARLDSDDWSYPYRLKEEVEFLEANPDVGLVGGGCHIADTSARIIGVRNIKTRNPYKTLLNRCIYQQSDVMFRRDVLERLAGSLVYRGKFKGAEDYDLWLRLSEITVVAKLNRVFSVWTLNIGGYTLSRKREQMEAIAEIKKMARARRRGGKDWYDEFRPKVRDTAHRTSIKPFEYDMIVAQVLLKERRTAEVQEQLRVYKSDGTNWATVRKWYYLSFVPRPVLKLLFGFREYLLSNSFLELR